MADNRIVTENVKKKLQVINVDKYKKYTLIEKELFEETRNAMLEIFPIDNGTFDSRSILYAENFAFTMTDKYMGIINKKMDEILAKVEKELSLIQAAAQSTNTAN